MQKEFYEMVSNFFNFPLKSLKPSISISTLSKKPHDQILFTFELEKRFHIEFDDDEIEKMDKISSYLKLIKKKLEHKSTELKKAA